MKAGSNISDAADFARAMLTSHIEALLDRLHPGVSRERRNDDRIAIPALFRLTPLDANRQPIESQAAIVVGKNISRRGMSFFHERPTPYRRAIIELAQAELGRFAAEIDLNWCRFTRPGWYESGGRLIRLVSQNFDRPRDGVDNSVGATHSLAPTTGEFGAGMECHI